ncbi:hypothetical protein [Bacillus sp. JJ722]|uniref:hypothetical protein n=1 Tax=Bacillus sp. JJ722 TaxID=3122973 RepID=UPI0030009A50
MKPLVGDGTAIISLDENATYYVKDGQLKKVDNIPSGYGTQTIVWKKGKPEYCDIQYTSK